MAEYRIVAKIDPSGVTAGKAKVKQDLRDIDTSAAVTKRGLKEAFDPASLSGPIGSLTQRIGTLETSLDKLVTSSNRVADGLEKAGKSGRSGAQGQDAMAAATRRVLQAVDQEAAELMRLNQLLADAKRLHEQGAISATQLARVQDLVNNGIKNQIPTLQQQRAGFMMAGQQVQDWTQQLALGINPLVVLAQQGGQTASALQMALGETGTAGRVAGFMAGPWGSLILAATAVLGMMAYRALNAGSELEKLTKDLEDDARQAELTAQAQRMFGDTLDGVTDALRKNQEALKALDDQHKSAAQRALENALAAEDRLRGIRTETQALIDHARVLLEVQRARATGPTQAADIAALGLPERQAELTRLEGRLADIDRDIAAAERQRQDALSRAVVERVDVDPVERIRERYEDLIDAARRRAVAEGTVSTALADQVRKLGALRDAEIKREQDRTRETKRGDGVSRFKTRQQAIGIAGRELQRGGLRVGENDQFGGVQGNHPGMGNAAHGRYAIDVNSGTGVNEADIPDLRRRFDELARRYQARGYRVLWNGQVYEANGSGPSGPIRRGSQHRDHMHVEAPQSIVGRATNASGESQFMREENAAERQAEQERDFIQGVVDQSAGKGVGGRADNLEAQIARRMADFKRRFDREMNAAEQETVRNALTEADVRETALRFDEAYIQPLMRLQALQGKTGLEREILNAQLEESTRLGRDLTPIEEERIENSMRQSDALEREAQILADIRAPLQDYQDRLAALNALLERGEISQTAFNARVAELGDNARGIVGDMPGVDPATGESYGDLAAKADEEARYAQELAAIETNKQQILQMGIDYDALIEAAHRNHVQRMNAIDQARRQTVIGDAQSIADSLLGIAEMTAGKQSAVYKAMFVASKAFAIADAIIKIQQGIATALSLPFPANLAAIASVTAAAASIVSNIQAVSLNLADGGYISGPGGPRDDRIPVNASNGEFMVNAEATAKNRALLEAINAGNITAHTRRASNDNIAAGSGVGAPRVTINNLAGGVEFEVERGLTMEEVVITARRVAREESPRAVAADLRDANGRTRKALQQVGVRGKRQ